MALLDEITYPQPLAEPLRHAFADYREKHPWVLESDLSPKSVVRDMYEAGPHVHGADRLLRHRALGGPGAALSERHLPRAAPDRPGALQDRRARRHHRVAGGDRPPGRLLAAGRVGGPDRPGVRRPRGRRRRGRRADRARAPDHRQRARVPRDGPQRDVPAGPARRQRRLRRPRRPRTVRQRGRSSGSRPSAPTGTSTSRSTPARPPAPRSSSSSTPKTWTVRQIIEDPEGNHDWAIVAKVDVDASDAAGEPVIRTESFGGAR